MPATISGVVFNDLNHNGVYDAGESGIAGVYIYLSSTSGMVESQTDANGNYTFTVTAAGSYTIYETAVQNTSNPPTIFSQPDGFTLSNGPRKIVISVTAANISNGATLGNNNFAHDTNVNPLACTANFIQFVGDPTQWVTINLVTGKPTMQGVLNPADYVNAIGYNAVDDYLYGYDLTTNKVVRIDVAGNLMTLGLPTGMPVTSNQYNTGCLDDNGYFYAYYGGAARMYVIDLRPNSATYMKLVDPTNGFSEQTSNYGVALVNGTPNVADWVWLPSNAQTGANTNGFLFGIQSGGVMARVNVDNARVINMTTSGPMYSNSYGAMSVDAAGNIYAIANQNGNIYRYTINGITTTGVYFSNTYYDNHNDGAMCRNARLMIDFGDAPDAGIGNGPGNYNTLLASNGPRHQVIPGIMLGTQITAEEDAYQNSDATGDDLTQSIQDDGLITPLSILSISATTYQLEITVTNSNGLPANLYGWIDFNQNGLFEVNESSAIVVPANSGTATYLMAFSVPVGVELTAGSTFARFRLTTDALVQGDDGTGQDGASVGPAGDGEVEDYILTISPIADLQITKAADQETIAAGGTLTYTMTIVNNGPDAAESPLFMDNLPPELKNPTYSIDSGQSWQDVTQGSLTIPTLQPEDVFTILVRGTVDAFATGIINNIASVSSITPDPDLSNNSDQTSTDITYLADLSVTKMSPNSVTAGADLTYTLVIANAGPSIAENVILTDSTPTVLIDPQYSLDEEATWQPWMGELALGELAANGSLTVQIQGTIDPSTVENVVNVATVKSDTADPNLDNNTSTVETAIVEAPPLPSSADIGVVKTLLTDPFIPGNPMLYQLLITNYGPSTAQGVVLLDPVPTGVLNPQFSVDNGATWQPWLGSLTLGTLTANETVTLLIQGTLSPATVTTITNMVTIYASTPDPDGSNNTSITSNTPIPTATLNVTKIATPDPVTVDGTLIYSIYVLNEGPSFAHNVVVTDVIPPELRDVVYSTDGINWQPWTGSYTYGTIPSGGARTLLIKGIVAKFTQNAITNTAHVKGDDTLDSTSTVSVDVVEQADVGILKWANTNHVIAGNALRFSLMITNYGPSIAAGVVVTDAISDTLSNVQYSLDKTDWQPWTGDVSLGDLAVDQVVVIELQGTVTTSATDEIVNTALVTSETTDLDLTNNASSFEVYVGESADLAITKTSDSAVINLGDLLTYTITVTNYGPSDAEGVTLQDNVSTDLSDAQFSLNNTDWLPWISPYDLGLMLPDETQTIYVKGTVIETATNFIANIAVVTSNTTDPDPSNNVAVNISSVIQPDAPTPTREDALNQIISSIAMEELGLSHILNVEGEKIQYVLGTLEGSIPPEVATIDDVLRVNNSVQKMLEVIFNHQLVLKEKMSKALHTPIKLDFDVDE